MLKADLRHGSGCSDHCTCNMYYYVNAQSYRTNPTCKRSGYSKVLEHNALHNLIQYYINVCTLFIKIYETITNILVLHYVSVL